MASFNRVILMGNLTRDIELRYTPGGTAVTDAALAVNNKRKNQNNEWVDEVCYVDVTLWGRTAEVASEYLSKGSPIFVEGHLKLDMWETDGKKNSRLRVVCERMQMVGGKSGGGTVDSGARRSQSSHASAPSGQTSSASAPGNSGSPDASGSHDPSGSQGAVSPQGSQPTGDASPNGGGGYEDADIPF